MKNTKKKTVISMDEQNMFANYRLLPDEVQEILFEFGDESGYEVNEQLLQKLKPLGYIFDYGLDGVAFDLRKIK